jgi:hypothetical protein
VPPTEFVSCCLVRCIRFTNTYIEKKCSGDLPHCSNCQTNGLDCVYEQTRRDRLVEFVYPSLSFSFRLRVMYRAKHVNHKLTTLLRDLSERVPKEDKKRIDDALENVGFFSSKFCMAIRCLI